MHDDLQDFQNLFDLRQGYPRPDFVRRDWLSLNGEWEFSFDEPVFDKKIIVPYCYQSKASGIGDTAQHDVVWYRRVFRPDAEKVGNCSTLLHFGAVDYEAEVWLNDKLVGRHEGGHTPFFFDITDFIAAGDNTIMLKACDRLNADKPRGKQSWIGRNFGCWYTPTTGIWQNVWIEYAGRNYLRRVKITPDLNNLQATCEVFISNNDETKVSLCATMACDGEERGAAGRWDSAAQRDGGGVMEFGTITFTCKEGYGKAVIAFPDMDLRRGELLWAPETPNLIDVEIHVQSDGCAAAQDVVLTYFGMREINAFNGKLMLNGSFYYQRLILDQGYWPDTLLTPPDAEAIIADIKLSKEMGFNGARKHQKIEDPRYYYWADRLGFLVWGELPSAYEFNDNAIGRSMGEMAQFVARDYNHPCIVAWVPINESWGVRNVKSDTQQQNYARALLYMIKALDRTRLVSVNDGWEQTEDTDFCTIHDYALFPSTITKYADMEGLLATFNDTRAIYADGCKYTGQPIIMSEYGGIAFADDAESGWGYFENAADEQAFLGRLEPITRFLINSGKFSGFCYTQLTDVMQEVNGLLREDRTPKIDTKKLSAIFGRPLMNP